MSTPIGQTALHLAQTFALRAPALVVSATCLSAMGELAIKIVNKALEVMGFQRTPGAQDKTSNWFEDKGIHLRPFKNLSAKDVALTALAAGVIGVAGTELVGYLMGAPSPAYNQVFAALCLPFRLADTSPFGLY